MALADQKPLLYQPIFPWGPPLFSTPYNRSGITLGAGDVVQFDTGLTVTAETDPTDLVAVTTYDQTLSGAFGNVRIADGTANASKLGCGIFAVSVEAKTDNKPMRVCVVGEVGTIRCIDSDFATLATPTAGSPGVATDALRSADIRVAAPAVGLKQIVIIKGAVTFADATTAIVSTVGALVNGLYGWG